ncbi:hypothetical protein QBC43DRAFT_293567 [Cladorrhinum sp. PSN259]|nr:hypothetical protein QBC43DRAFT_293567 [Cladorrhinum sp. PSN259]
MDNSSEPEASPSQTPSPASQGPPTSSATQGENAQQLNQSASVRGGRVFEFVKFWNSQSTIQSPAPGVPQPPVPPAAPGPAAANLNTTTTSSSSTGLPALLNPNNASSYSSNSSGGSSQLQSTDQALSASPSLAPLGLTGSPMRPDATSYIYRPSRAIPKIPDIVIHPPSTVDREFSPPLPAQDDSGNFLMILREDTKHSRRLEEKRVEKLLQHTKAWMKRMEEEDGRMPSSEWVHVGHPAWEADDYYVYEPDTEGTSSKRGSYTPIVRTAQPKEGHHDDGHGRGADGRWSPERSKEMHEAQLNHEMKFGKYPTRARLQDSFAGPSNPSSSSQASSGPVFPRLLGSIPEEEDNEPTADGKRAHYESDASVDGYKGKGKEKVPGRMYSSGPSAPHSSSPKTILPPVFGGPSLSLPTLRVSGLSQSLSPRPSPATGRFYPPSIETSTSRSPSDPFSSSPSSLGNIPRSLVNEALYAVQGSSYIPPKNEEDDGDPEDQDSETEDEHILGTTEYLTARSDAGNAGEQEYWLNM